MATSMNSKVKALIRDVPDFPKPGIIFKDITPVLKDPAALRSVIDEFAKIYGKKDVQAVAGIESRGFILGAPLAYDMKVPFIPIRKEGKLPYKKIKASYSLEYGEATIEMHSDAVERGQRVLIIDDLLATGGTAAASIGLVEQLGGEVVSCGFVIELEFLRGRERLPRGKVESLITY
jgi:adenine phosphoribosyltransferase